MITIDKLFTIEADDTCRTLIKTENKTRVDPKTQETVNYISKENWHFLNIEQCLNRYLDLCMNPCESVKDVLEAIKDAKLSISKLRK